MVNLEQLRDLLMMLKQYPEVKTFRADGMEIELDRELDQAIEDTVQIPLETGMPPDSVMLYASTDSFDEMMEKQEGKGNGD